MPEIAPTEFKPLHFKYILVHPFGLPEHAEEGKLSQGYLAAGLVGQEIPR